MYTAYWHLKEFPFENLTDPRFAYLSDQHREGLARLLYLVRGRKLGGILVGPYGVGKSMILELVSQSLQSKDADTSRFVRFDTPPGGPPAFVHRMLQVFGDPQPTSDPAEALQRINTAGTNGKDDITGGVHTVMAVDEAQLIRETFTFELLHLLTNMRRPTLDGRPEQPMFTILLSGHDDLLKHVDGQPSLRQRLQIVWKLEPLDENQTQEYVQRRIQAAGGSGIMFTEDALREIHHASRGLPRIINNICDLSLMMGCAAGVAVIEQDIVQQAARDGTVPAADK